MSFDVMKIFQDEGFRLKELIIKEQHNCRATGYWKTNSQNLKSQVLSADNHRHNFVPKHSNLIFKTMNKFSLQKFIRIQICVPE